MTRALIIYKFRIISIQECIRILLSIIHDNEHEFSYLEYNTFNWLHISFLPGLHQIANAIIKRSKLTIRIKRKTFGLLMPKNEK
ncbi:hypothetical protein V1477_016565 [Vespula maculifrons]|uniref:Maturase K n=1 Tax=Vespula maculifrons TaxID=7453 RepID=A0ABD2B8M7_VESMC